LLDVALVVLLLAALQAAAGERRRALRLATSYAVAAGAVLLLLHASALPGFVRDVLPHLRDGAPESRGLPTEVWGRLAPFYDTLLPLLALGGLSVAGAVPVHARRYLMAATAAGLLLLVLRVALPVPLVHARDLELLALPVAVTSTLALHRLWGTGPAGRIAGLACLAGVAYFCVSRGLAILSTRVLMPVR
jgi:hypothetical protein